MNGIRMARKRAGLTQDELARKLKVSQTTISLWESGFFMPNSAKLLPLAKILSCSIEELLKR